MKRPAIAWAIFTAAFITVASVMGFLTARMLDYERRTAREEARAAREEAVRLALWRMDSATATFKSGLTQQADLPTKSENAYSVKQQRDSNFQKDLNRIEQQQRQSLASNSAIQMEQQTVALMDDWTIYKPALLERVRDILPQADLESAEGAPDDDPRRLVTIPARLVLPPLEQPELPWNTPVRTSLIIAWACVAISGAGVGMLLAATLSLSERRGAFASAVTHELRTPLTTFRLYSELLASEKIAEGEARREYAKTLVGEADRLAHLVENVLAYARVEKRAHRAHLEPITVGELLDRATPALGRRAEQAGLPLAVRIDDPATGLVTDAVAVQQILLNLVDNACKYGRSAVTITTASSDSGVEIRVIDAGPGMGDKRPFIAFDKARNDPVPGIGLGLYLSRQLARGLGGDLVHEPAASGATFTLRLPRRVTA